MHEHGAPATQVCTPYWISRKIFSKWYGRYREAGTDCHVLTDHSRRPIGTRDRCPNALQNAWWPCGARPATVPRRLAYYLAQEGHHDQRLWRLPGPAARRPSPQATLPAAQEAPELRHGGSRPARPDRRQVPAPPAPEGMPRALRQYLYNAIDCSTRLQVAYVSSELTPRASVRFLQHLRRSFPFPIQEVQTDHDMEFTYVFFPHVRTPHPCRAGPR